MPKPQLPRPCPSVGFAICLAAQMDSAPMLKWYWRKLRMKGPFSMWIPAVKRRPRSFRLLTLGFLFTFVLSLGSRIGMRERKRAEAQGKWKHFGKRNHFYIAVTLWVLYGDHRGWSAFITELHLIHSICLAEVRLKSQPNSIGSLREAGSHWTQNRRAVWPQQDL